MKSFIFFLFLASPIIAYCQSIADIAKNIDKEPDVIKNLAMLESINIKSEDYTPFDIAHYWKLLALSQQKNGKFSDSVYSATQSINSIEKNKLPISKLLVNSYVIRANSIYRIQDNDHQYCKDVEIALNLVKKLPNEKASLASILSMNATCVFEQKNDITLAFTMIERAIDIAQSNELTLEQQASIFNEAALIYRKLGIFDKAYQYNLIAKEKWHEKGDFQGVYYMLRNLSVAATDMGEFDKATFHLSELATFAKSHSEFKDIPFYLSYHHAVIARAKKDWVNAIRYFEQSISHEKLTGNNGYIQAAYEQLALMYFLNGNQAVSNNIITKISKKFDANVVIKKEVLPLKFFLLNDPAKALIESYKLINIEKNKRRDFIKLSLGTSAQINDNNLKQLDNLKLKQQRNYIIFSSLFLFMLILVFVVIQQSRNKLILKEKQLSELLLTQKNKLLADVSHELATPLTVLKLQVESLKDDLEDDVHATYDALDNKITDIEHLIDDIHQLAQSDIGAIILNINTFELNNTLDTWQEEFTQMIQRNKLDFEMSKVLPESLPIDFDRERIKQIMTNLLTNSIKYTDKPGRVKLTATSKNNTLVLSIEDSAPSVSSEDLTNIFERLYRVEGSRSRETGGSGLGLAICKSLIEAHNGNIYAQHSNLGGIKIVVELPFSLKLLGSVDLK
jgi:signal transduction histidine kinase